MPETGAEHLSIKETEQPEQTLLAIQDAPQQLLLTYPGAGTQDPPGGQLQVVDPPLATKEPDTTDGGKKRREFVPLQLGEAEREENQSYLASVTLLGNRMMLSILAERMKETDNQLAKDDAFEQVRRRVGLLLSHYGERVDKESFPLKYGNMMGRYAAAREACLQYVEKGNRPTKKKSKQALALRDQTITQTLNVIDREMLILRERGGALAHSEAGMTWLQFFAEEGRKSLEELRNREKEKEQPAKPLPTEKAEETAGEKTEEKPKETGEQGKQETPAPPKAKSMLEERNPFLEKGDLLLTQENDCAALLLADGKLAQDQIAGLLRQLKRYGMIQRSDNELMLGRMETVILRLLRALPDAENNHAVQQMIAACRQAAYARAERQAMRLPEMREVDNSTRMARGHRLVDVDVLDKVLTGLDEFNQAQKEGASADVLLPMLRVLRDMLGSCKGAVDVLDNLLERADGLYDRLAGMTKLSAPPTDGRQPPTKTTREPPGGGKLLALTDRPANPARPDELALPPKPTAKPPRPPKIEDVD